MDTSIKKRNLLARIYNKNLNNSKFLPLSSEGDYYCNHYKQIVISEIKRSKIEKFLNKNNISLTGGVYYVPLHRQPVYKNSLKKYKLPITDYFCEKHFCPPCYPELSSQDIYLICKNLNKL